MKGVTFMEVILIAIAITAAALIVFINLTKPIKKSDLNGYVSQAEFLETLQTMKKLSENIEGVTKLVINNESKIATLNRDLLAEVERTGEEFEETETDIDKAQEHIALVSELARKNDDRLNRITAELEKTVHKVARPLLVKLVQDKSLRTYTIEKVRRTKTGYEKKSLTRILKKKNKTQPIKKLNLPGVEASKESLVKNQL